MMEQICKYLYVMFRLDHAPCLYTASELVHGVLGYGVGSKFLTSVPRFLPNAPQFGEPNASHFRSKMCLDPCIAVLYETLQHGHHSAADMVGEEVTCDISFSSAAVVQSLIIFMKTLRPTCT